MILAMFDIDGTLTIPITIEASYFAKAICSVLGDTSIDTDWSNCTHVTDDGIATEAVQRSLGRDITESELNQIRQVYINLMWPCIEKECKPISGAVRFLEALKCHTDISVGIATGNWREVGTRKLETAGFLIQDIPFASSTDAVARHEIMRYAHLRALSRCQINAFDKIVYFGDGGWDAQASLKLGWDFIGISTQMSRDDLRQMGAKAVYDNYSNPEEVRNAIFA